MIVRASWSCQVTMLKICAHFSFLHVDNLRLHQTGITGGLSQCIKIILIYKAFRSYIDCFHSLYQQQGIISYVTLPLIYCFAYLMNLLT